MSIASDLVEGEVESEDDHSVAPLELFFDLVFVLAITEVTAFMSTHASARGMLQGLIILGLLWWSWVGYAWLTNSVDTGDTATRIAFFVAMAGLSYSGYSLRFR